MSIHPPSSPLSADGPRIDPTSAAVTLAKLQTPVKSSFDSINDSLKETHSGLNKYTKSLDKVCACAELLDIGLFLTSGLVV